MASFFSLSGMALKNEFPVRANWYTDGDSAPFNFFQSTIIVPNIPAKNWKTLFLWPGLQPNHDKSFLPVGNGVLQPVLAYGNSCAPNPSGIEIDYKRSWWISAQYVNIYTDDEEYKGCFGGDQMAVDVGDAIEMTMELLPNTFIWNQTVLNKSNGKKVTFSMDMKNQNQGWAEFVMETTNGWKIDPPSFLVLGIELRTATLNPKGFCVYKEIVNKENEGSNLHCEEPIFISSNICRISHCSFNKPELGHIGNQIQDDFNQNILLMANPAIYRERATSRHREKLVGPELRILEEQIKIKKAEARRPSS